MKMARFRSTLML